MNTPHLWASKFPQFCRGVSPPGLLAGRAGDAIVADASPIGAGGSSTVVNLGELMMILELHRQRLKGSAIARQLGVDRKTVRKYNARGLEPPAYGPRPVQQKKH